MNQKREGETLLREKNYYIVAFPRGEGRQLYSKFSGGKTTIGTGENNGSFIKVYLLRRRREKKPKTGKY